MNLSYPEQEIKKSNQNSKAGNLCPVCLHSTAHPINTKRSSLGILLKSDWILLWFQASY